MSPVFVMTYPYFGFVCAIVAVAIITNRKEIIDFFIIIFPIFFLNVIYQK